VVEPASPGPHLSWGELECHDGTPYPLVWRETRLPVLARVFEDFRTFMGSKPLVIGSAFRTMRWNRKQGGALKSQHVQGRALDLHCPRGMALKTFRAKAKMFAQDDVRVGGLGWYKWGVHLDTRDRGQRLAFWSRVNAGTRLHDSRRV